MHDGRYNEAKIVGYALKRAIHQTLSTAETRVAAPLAEIRRKNEESGRNEKSL